MSVSSKVLITGATGFIGRHLCRLLVDQGMSVRAVTRGPTGCVEGVEYRRGDLHDEHFLRASLEGIDCVVHLAGRAHILNKKNDASILYRQTNHDLTLRVAKRALSCGVKRFVFLSTIGVNGKTTVHKRFDEVCAVNPLADYAISKYDAEVSLQGLLASESMDWVIIRPPLVYGADAPGNFKTLLRVVHRGLPSPFMLVKNARSIISVDNLNRFIAMTVESPDASRQVFLVSDGADISTHEMLRALSRGMERRFLSVPIPGFILGIASALIGKQELYTQLCGSLTVDCSKAQALGYQPHSDTYSALVEVGKTYASAVHR